MNMKDLVEGLDASIIIRVDRGEIWAVKDGQITVTEDTRLILRAYDAIMGTDLAEEDGE